MTERRETAREALERAAEICDLEEQQYAKQHRGLYPENCDTAEQGCYSCAAAIRALAAELPEGEKQDTVAQELLADVVLALDYWMTDEALLAEEDRDQWSRDIKLKQIIEAMLAAAPSHGEEEEK